MSDLILTLICTIFQVCLSTDPATISCEYKTVPPGFIYITGQQYECILQSDYPYVNNQIVSVNGTHIDGNSDTNVTMLTINDKKITEIPNLNSHFSNLKYINVQKSSLKALSRQNLANFKDSLEHLVIRNSGIEIIQEDLFVDLTKLVTIDLRNNSIFYISSVQFTNLPNLRNFLLESNNCINPQTQQDIKNSMLPSDTTSMTAYIQSIKDSTCGLINPEFLVNLYLNSKLLIDIDAYKAEQIVNTILDVLTQRNDDFDALQDQLNVTANNLTALTQKYQNSIAENEELHVQIQQLKVKVTDLESMAEQCLDVNGTCRFTDDETYGYSCIAHGINVTKSGDVIDWSGEHDSASADEDVKALIIRYLNVQFVPKKIAAAFSNLKILTIQNCGLKRLSKDDFDDLEELLELRIAGNEITSIEAGSFDGLTALKVLDLSNNKIKVLPSKIFAMLNALTYLNLSNNSLTALKSNFLPSTNFIDSFIGTNNQFTNIESTFVWRLRSASLIDFTGSSCDLKFDKDAGDQFLAFYNVLLRNC
ncbi:leucine-rich repeat-containing protein egg-6-like [Chironomus tepperi]|uniref:leucine-rich repeat-containing protein egg-6-like n=1 Tax=Chironomus tepperi TaxID=113505 RepID=UPI00391F4DEB